MTDVYFFLLFLPAVLLGWHLLLRFSLGRCSLVFLLAASLYFYGRSEPLLCLWLLSSGIFSYALVEAMHRARARRGERALLIVGLVTNIGLLVFLKFGPLLMAVRWSLLIPLGVSFFTFRQIAYLVDAFRDPSDNTRFSPLEYFASLAFFPSLPPAPSPWTRLWCHSCENPRP